MEGVNISDLKKLMGINLIKKKNKELQFLKDESMIEDFDNSVILTKYGKKIIDHIVEKITI